MSPSTGRWPANVLLSHLPECERVGVRKVKTSDPRRADGSVNAAWGTKGIYGGASSEGMEKPRYTEDGTETVPAYDCAENCPVRELDEQSGDTGANGGQGQFKQHAWMEGDTPQSIDRDNSGGASRFFYCAKASRAERNAGLEGFEEKPAPGAVGMQTVTAADWGDPDQPTYERTTAHRNSHPTVKPIELMRWLVRLVTPPGGRVLDPFAGSGTTGCAAVLEGFDFIGIEREQEYVEIARARLAWWSQFAGESTDAILIRAGYSERLKREHDERGQLTMQPTLPDPEP
jgi:hypothetical protein